MDAYQAPTVSRLSSTSRQTDNSDISQMLQQISERLARLETTREDHVHHKRPRSRARSPSRNHNSREICWYHETYQEKALRCKQPCSFQQILSRDKGNAIAETAAFGQNQVSRLFHVNHIKGDVVADALSRTDINAVTTVDLQEIAKHQAAETTPRTDMPSLEIIVPLPFSHGNILVDVSTGVHRPLVPENLRHKVFLSLHSLSYPGARATSKLVRQRFMWPHMDKEHGAENVSPVRKARFYSPSKFSSSEMSLTAPCRTIAIIQRTHSHPDTACCF